MSEEDGGLLVPVVGLSWRRIRRNSPPEPPANPFTEAPNMSKPTSIISKSQFESLLKSSRVVVTDCKTVCPFLHRTRALLRTGLSVQRLT